MRNAPDLNALLRTPTSIVNGSSSGSPTPGAFTAQVHVKSTASGALTANTLATMLSLTGPGVLKFAGVQSADTTSRTLRIQILLDGATVFDVTSAATTTSGAAIVAVGHFMGTAAGITVGIYEYIPFNSSCVIKIASSITETDKLNYLVAYHLS